MITITSPSFWLFFLFFFVAVFLAYYLPGAFFLKKLLLTNFQKTVLSVILGMVLWGWQGYIFGYLGVRWFSYLYIALFLILWLRQTTPFKLPKIKLHISFLANRQIFLSGSGIPVTHGIDPTKRKKIVQQILYGPDTKITAKLLLQYNINYIYILPYMNIQASESSAFLEKVYINKYAKILEVNQLKAKEYVSSPLQKTITR